MCKNNVKTSEMIKKLHLDLILKYDLSDDEIEFLLKLNDAIEIAQKKITDS